MSRLYATHINLNQNQLLNPVIHLSSVAPASPLAGQLWFNNTAGVMTLNVYNGNIWLSLGRLDQLSAPVASVNMNNNVITNLANPTNPQDAVNLRTLENAIQGLRPKVSCRVRATGNINLTSPGTAIDGVTLVNGDRVLVTQQTNTSQNGIYTFNGSASAMTRTTDADVWDELVSAFIFIEEGTNWKDTGWLCTVNRGGTLGTTSITFVQFSSAGLIEVTNATGTGISLVNAKSGNQYPIKKINGRNGAQVTDVSGVAMVSPVYGTTANTILQGTHHGSTGSSHGLATPSVNGFMSSADKAKLNAVKAPYIVLNTANTANTTVTHNLGSTNLHVQIYETATGNLVEADVSNRLTNSLVVTFSPIPTTQKYTIVVQG